MKTNWKKANDVVCEEVGEGALLVEAKTGRRWVLNAAAAALWKLEAAANSVNEFAAQCNSGTMYRLAGDMPVMKELGLSASPRRRPSPRGNSSPG